MPLFSKPDVNRPWASAGVKVAPDPIKLDQGWVEEIPPREWQNFLNNRSDQFLAHVNQLGVVEWDSATEYQANKSYVQGSNGVIYKAKTTNTNQNPVSDTSFTYWGIAFDAYGSSAAVAQALNTHISNYNTLAGLTNLSVARNNLGLGTAATRNVGLSAGSVMEVGAFGVGVGAPNLSDPDISPGGSGFQYFTCNGPKMPLTSGFGVMHLEYSSAQGYAVQIASTPAGGSVQSRTFIRSKILGAWSSWFEILRRQDLTTFSQSLLTLSNASQWRTTLGLGTAAQYNVGTASGQIYTRDQAYALFSKMSSNLADLTNIPSARANLGLGSASLKNVVNVPGDLNFAASIAPNGYQRLPSGLILQWGNFHFGDINGASQQRGPYNFPIPFPNYCATMVTSAINGAQGTYYPSIITNSQFWIYGHEWSGNVQNATVTYVAIGV